MNFDSSNFIPFDVPEKSKKDFLENYNKLTRGTNRLMIFSCDQKIEHLNTDFFGPKIDSDANNPKNIFQIASQGNIGGLATQLGLIARYAKEFPNINYIVKLNSKTNIIPTEIKDPLSTELWSVNDVVEFKNETNLQICAVGYTIYIGSKYEHIMIHEAAQIINHAHKHGLVAILWAYPRGKSVKNEKSGIIIAGAAGIANALGADFVKINAPKDTLTQTSSEQLKIITQAAGNTKVLCAGGEQINEQVFLNRLYYQITKGGTSGAATGRNIFQRSLDEAIAMTNAISAIIYDLADPAQLKFKK